MRGAEGPGKSVATSESPWQSYRNTQQLLALVSYVPAYNAKNSTRRGTRRGVIVPYVAAYSATNMYTRHAQTFKLSTSLPA